jgi:hypothetical protein
MQALASRGGLLLLLQTPAACQAAATCSSRGQLLTRSYGLQETRQAARQTANSQPPYLCDLIAALAAVCCTLKCLLLSPHCCRLQDGWQAVSYIQHARRYCHLTCCVCSACNELAACLLSVIPEFDKPAALAGSGCSIVTASTDLQQPGCHCSMPRSVASLAAATCIAHVASVLCRCTISIIYHVHCQLLAVCANTCLFTYQGSPLGKLLRPSSMLSWLVPVHLGQPPSASSFSHTITPSGQHLHNMGRSTSYVGQHAVYSLFATPSGHRLRKILSIM